MTIQPSRTSTRHSVGAQKLPAAMMTIPDFCWRPAIIVRPDAPPAAASLAPTPETAMSPPPSPSPEPSTARGSWDSGAQSPHVVRREQTGRGTTDVPRWKEGLRRHWLPMGGVAIALLWIASVLISGGDAPQNPLAPPAPRQARRQATPELTPLAKGKLRAAGRQTPEVSASRDEGLASGSTSQTEVEPELFERVPALSSVPQQESPDSELPPLPTFNPPSGTPAAVDSTLDPETTVEGSPTASPGVDASRPRTVERSVPGDGVPLADEPPIRARETEYEWGTPSGPTTNGGAPQDGVREAGSVARSSAATASDSRAVPSGRSAYRQTDPASYKDPLYVIPPLARQPRPSGYR